MAINKNTIINLIKGTPNLVYEGDGIFTFDADMIFDISDYNEKYKNNVDLENTLYEINDIVRKIVDKINFKLQNICDNMEIKTEPHRSKFYIYFINNIVVVCNLWQMATTNDNIDVPCSIIINVMDREDYELEYGEVPYEETVIEPDAELVKKLTKHFIKNGENKMDAEDLAYGLAEEIAYCLENNDMSGVEDAFLSYGIDMDYFIDFLM